jgi:hypothetical protein
MPLQHLTINYITLIFVPVNDHRWQGQFYHTGLTGEKENSKNITRLVAKMKGTLAFCKTSVT